MASVELREPRLAPSTLETYAFWDTPADAVFDELTKIAARICRTPICLISLLDANRFWFKSMFGPLESEIPLLYAFCADAIRKDGAYVVPDAGMDERLASHPTVISDFKFRFYADAPLVTAAGLRMGTLCVIDIVPRILTTEQTEALESLAKVVVAQLEHRNSARLYQTAQEELTIWQATTEALSQQRTAQLMLAHKSLQRLAGELMRAQDDERRRIARDLHDTTGQVLAGLRMALDRLQNSSSPENPGGFQECRELLSLASSEIRNLSYLLHPPLMDEIGLTSAVTEYVQGFEKRSGISVQLETSREIGRLDGDREIALFRVIQEGLGNIHRHSGSTTALIKMVCLADDVILEIRDRGKGLRNAPGKSSSFGVGIRSMEERLRQFGGSLQIQSSHDGTSVRAVMPRHART